MIRDQIEKRGIKDPRVLEAMRTVKRHLFVPEKLKPFAYADRPLSIGHGQTISQPYIVAFMTETLDLKPDDRVLEIGTGSGYQAAILAALGGRVFTVERQEALYQQADALLSAGRFGNIRVFLRDGYKGLPEFAPFDRIIVTAGASEVPRALLDQLAPGGIMVIPVDHDGGQEMWRLVKDEQGEIEKRSFGFFRFVPFLKGIVKE
jgi:protein-L-isoaspartate(D-aspartate) O-methyltransferase